MWMSISLFVVPAWRFLGLRLARLQRFDGDVRGGGMFLISDVTPSPSERLYLPPFTEMSKLTNVMPNTLL